MEKWAICKLVVAVRPVCSTLGTFLVPLDEVLDCYVLLESFRLSQARSLCRPIRSLLTSCKSQEVPLDEKFLLFGYVSRLFRLKVEFPISLAGSLSAHFGEIREPLCLVIATPLAGRFFRTTCGTCFLAHIIQEVAEECPIVYKFLQ